MYITRKTRKAIIIMLIIFVLAVLGLVYFWMLFEKEQFYDDFDVARKEYNLGVSKAEVYEKKDDDCVERITIYDSYDDNNLSNVWFHTNHNKVTVFMNHKTDTLPIKERCTRFVNIMNEVRPNIDQYFKSSRYYRIYKANSGLTSMEYRGIHLTIYHTSEFVFVTSDNTYAFIYVNSMTHTDKDTGHVDYYDYIETRGELTKFENRYGSKNSSSKSSTVKPTEQHKKNNSSSSGNKKYYDPYDVHDYKSAQDFADDKYEEFYDYEDDFEDEDEAYDAAEDYWNEHH